ncbi:MAG: DUF3108 domain-containing protein [Methylotenera sp.]
MWIKIFQAASKALRQDASYKRFALALVFSLLLHIVLIGKFNFNLPNFNNNRHVIEARLVLPKAALLQPVRQEQAPEPVAEHVPEPMPPEVTPEIAESTPVVPVAINSNAVSETNLPEIADVPLAVPATKNVEITLNRKAYKYVETEFDVRTDIAANVDSNPVGRAKILYKLLSNNEQYQLKSEIEGQDLAPLALPNLQTSDGYLSKIGLEPQHYLAKIGGNNNKTLNAEFEWEGSKLSLHSAQSEQKLDLIDGTQDLLSAMYQFMLVAPQQKSRFNITNGEQIDDYDFSIVGEEIAATKMGNLNTMHLLRRVAEGEEKTELWLALDYQLVPVKIRKTAKDGKVYELLATSINTEQPANLQ